MVGISLVTAVVFEAISWLFIYRMSSYKSLKSTIDQASKKLETMKNPSGTSEIVRKSRTKEIDRVETSLKESNRDHSLFKFKSGAVIAIVLFVVFAFQNSLFEGKAVVKLPFVPLRMVQKMSHRGLPGDNMAFLYFLCSTNIRTNLQKFFGFPPPVPAYSQCLIPSPADQFWY